MRRQHLQAGELIERTVANQVLQGDRRGQRVAGRVAQPAVALQSLLFHCGFKLIHRERRVLHRQRRERGESIRLRRDQLRQFFVLDGDDFLGQVAVGFIPEWIDRQNFEVDRLAIHRGDTFLDGQPCLGAVVDRRSQRFGARVAHQVRRFVEQAVGMDVDGLDPFAVDHDRPACSPPAFGRAVPGWACAAPVSPQPQKTRPAVAAAFVRTFLREFTVVSP